MDHQPLRLTLEPIFSPRGRPLEVWQEAVPDSPDASGRVLLATIQPDRSLALANGTRYTIRPLGARWRPARALWRGEGPTSGDTPLAIFQRQRVGMLRWRSVLRVGGESGTAYLLRRRSWGAQWAMSTSCRCRWTGRMHERLAPCSCASRWSEGGSGACRHSCSMKARCQN